MEVHPVSFSKKKPDEISQNSPDSSSQVKQNPESLASNDEDQQTQLNSTESAESAESSEAPVLQELSNTGILPVISLEPEQLSAELEPQSKDDYSLSDDDVSARPKQDSSDSREEEEDYDPEVSLEKNQSLPSHLPSVPIFFSQKPSTSTVTQVPNSPPSDLENDIHTHVPVQDEEDEYDPEADLQNNASKDASVANPPNPHTARFRKPSTSKLFKNSAPAGLPPKPPVNANFTPSPSNTSAITADHADTLLTLKEAYESIMQRELASNPQFINLPQNEQLKIITDQLNNEKVQSNYLSTHPSHNHINYDQVYSYNKPFKNLKDPIPLVPVNEHCRRPNITLPMTPEEEKEYEEFVKNEAQFTNQLSWQEFPENLRLFIGNLPANTVAKQDLFRIFSQYGEVIQIAIKAGYGFVQFKTAEACLECIKGEANVPLHNKVMRLDASKSQKSKRNGRHDPQDFSIATSRARERSPELPTSKRSKPATDCIVYTTGRSSVYFVRRVKKAFESVQVSIQTEDITHRDQSDAVSEAAYTGVLAACFVKEAKVDVQTFESTSDGGIKFDEYADVDPEVAAEIISKAKIQYYGRGSPSVGGTSFADLEFRGANNYGNRERDRRSSGRNDRNKRDDWDRGRRGSGRGNGRGNSYSGNQGHGAHGYGTSRQVYNNDQSGQYNGFNQPSYQQPQEQHYAAQSLYMVQQPPQQQYQPQPLYPQYPQFSPPPPQPQVVQSELLHAIQGLDPSSVQNVLSALQNQQQQQQYQQPLPAPQFNYSNYTQPYNGQQSSNSSSPNSQVNALLSQLQGGTQQSFRPQQHQQQHEEQHRPQQQHGPTGSTQALMETLARLSRK